MTRKGVKARRIDRVYGDPRRARPRCEVARPRVVSRRVDIDRFDSTCALAQPCRHRMKAEERSRARQVPTPVR